MRKKNTSMITNLLIIEYFLINVYFSYRYILQYNFEGTSPTYSNTPFLFQVGKYAVLALGALACLMCCIKGGAKLKLTFANQAIFAVSSLMIFTTVLTGEYENIVKILSPLAIAYFILYVEDLGGFEQKFIRINKILLYYHIVYTAIQLFMFYAFGRLSALSYPNFQRYGGGYDDPNSMAMYLVLPIVYLCINGLKKGFSPKNVLLLAICLVLEVLTFGFTGYLALFTAILALVIIYANEIKFKRENKERNIAFIVAICLVAFIAVVLIFDRILELFNNKLGSIVQHFAQFALQPNTDGAKEFLFGVGNAHSENFWNYILRSYGLLGFIAMLVLCVYFTMVSFFVMKREEDTMSVVSFTFIFVVVVYSIMLPYLTFMPVNVIFWYLAFYSLKRYLCPKIVRGEVEKGGQPV